MYKTANRNLFQIDNELKRAREEICLEFESVLRHLDEVAERQRQAAEERLSAVVAVINDLNEELAVKEADLTEFKDGIKDLLRDLSQ